MQLFVPPVNNFFQVFFRRRFRRCALIGAAVPQRVFELCPFSPALSNTFFRFSEVFRENYYILLMLLNIL